MYFVSPMHFNYTKYYCSQHIWNVSTTFEILAYKSFRVVDMPNVFRANKMKLLKCYATTYNRIQTYSHIFGVCVGMIHWHTIHTYKVNVLCKHSTLVDTKHKSNFEYVEENENKLSVQQQQ